MFLLLLAIYSQAQKAIVLTDRSHLINIGKYISLYEDKEAKLRIEQISSPEFENRFEQSKSEIPNYNVTSSNIWCRLRLVNRSATSLWFLESSNASLDRIEVFTKDSSGIFRGAVSGFSTLIKEREFRISQPVFKMVLPKDSVVTCFICLNDQVPLQVHLTLGTQRDFIEKIQRQDILNGGFFGVLLMLMIYNLFIYFSVRDKVYFFYVLYVFSNFIFIGLVTGYAIHLPEWASTFIRNHPPVVAFLLGSTSCLFGIFFLDLKRTYVKGYRITTWFLVVFLSVPIIDFSGFHRTATVTVQILGLTFAFLSLTMGIIVWKRGYTPAKLFLFAYGFYLSGLIVYISADLTLLPFNVFTHNALEIGTAIEAILLSMAVADKINSFKREKELAQEQALTEIRKNAQLIVQQNVILEQKVKERTAELREQKEVVEEKQKEILDSIRYAKRIQNTLLAHRDFVDEHFPENFIFFKPKDIVSGDFYWAARCENKFYFAVCDSTGHGVPGAFMSLLNIRFLNEAIAEKRIEKPGEVFNYVRDRLVESISQDEQKDGMDGILICYDCERGELEYAAANNAPLLINAQGITELPADKMPVGKGEKNQSFTNYKISPVAGDMLIVYTDGFADQFGGPRGKKFKYRQLNELLQKKSDQHASKQLLELEMVFDSWKAELEQVDDVCVVGIRVPPEISRASRIS